MLVQPEHHDDLKSTQGTSLLVHNLCYTAIRQPSEFSLTSSCQEKVTQ